MKSKLQASTLNLTLPLAMQSLPIESDPVVGSCLPAMQIVPRLVIIMTRKNKNTV